MLRCLWHRLRGVWWAILEWQASVVLRLASNRRRDAEAKLVVAVGTYHAALRDAGVAANALPMTLDGFDDDELVPL